MNLERAVELCRKIEGVLGPIGFHVGLTGGCLYKDGDRKDADIIVYPHGKAAMPVNLDPIYAALKPLGLDLKYDESLPASAERDKVVRVCALKEAQSHPLEATRADERVDFFFFDSRPATFPPTT